jgi:hypothetical protein
LTAAAGPSHCGWDSTTFLEIGWPPGTQATNSSQQRQYVRDPRGIINTTHKLGNWSKNPVLPRDAFDTGYRYGALRLYFAPSDEESYAYLVAPRDSERWPRSDPPTLCS